ncbi:MAG: sulfite exporter TauE/SafE family protein [Hyphomonadaceae bacterium]|nr:sulfite exporter TauE/SafE family protein [Hyphomonadaceae bacterium]
MGARVAYVALLAVVLVSSTISGVFGMAGGLLLMGALTLALPVSAAMVTHGAVQIVSNGWRAVLHRVHIDWRILGLYALGSAAAGGVLALVTYAPSKAWVYLLLGLIPGLAWLPTKTLHLDAARPAHAFMCGLGVTGLNVAAGVAGPLLDVFFVRTSLTRHTIVATKAATQVLSHLAKVIFYGAPFLAANSAIAMPPVWFFAAAAPLAMLGGVLGGRILDAMSDKSFLRWTRWIVTALGALYLVQAASLFLGD